MSNFIGNFQRDRPEQDACGFAARIDHAPSGLEWLRMARHARIECAIGAGQHRWYSVAGLTDLIIRNFGVLRVPDHWLAYPFIGAPQASNMA
jgi:hypothetical protein